MRPECHAMHGYGSLAVRRWAWPRTTILALLCVALSLDPAAITLWQWDRFYVLDGQHWWAGLSGHLVHVSLGHLSANLLPLLLLGGLIESHSPRLWWLGLLGGGGMITLWLLLPVASVQYYAGLSGILNTLLVLALYTLGFARRSASPWLTAIYMGAAFKIVWELLAVPPAQIAGAWVACVPAHAIGFVSASLWVLCRSRLCYSAEYNDVHR